MWPLDWIYPEEMLQCPPSTKKGITLDEERRLRYQGIKIIMTVGPKARILINPTLATACTFFHRFYQHLTFQECPKELVALACLLLAGKVEETPKKCRDICTAGHMWCPKVFNQYTSNELVDEVMGMERVLLTTLRFDLQVEHPYRFLRPYLQKHSILSDATIAEYHKNAFAFVNDSFYTVACLRWAPEVLAIAMLSISFQVVGKFSPPSDWWSDYVANLTPSLVDNICHSVLDFYTHSKGDVFKSIVDETE